MMYTSGVRAEAMNWSQKSGGQPRRVTKNTTLSAVLVRGAVSHRFGMLVGLKVRARLRAKPARQAATKKACMTA